MDVRELAELMYGWHRESMINFDDDPGFAAEDIGTWDHLHLSGRYIWIERAEEVIRRWQS